VIEGAPDVRRRRRAASPVRSYLSLRQTAMASVSGGRDKEEEEKRKKKKKELSRTRTYLSKQYIGGKIRTVHVISARRAIGTLDVNFTTRTDERKAANECAKCNNPRQRGEEGGGFGRRIDWRFGRSAVKVSGGGGEGGVRWKTISD